MDTDQYTDGFLGVMPGQWAQRPLKEGFQSSCHFLLARTLSTCKDHHCLPHLFGVPSSRVLPMLLSGATWLVKVTI